MTDIVDRLRAMPSNLNDACREMDEAADTISGMRADVRLLRDVIKELLDIGVLNPCGVHRLDLAITAAKDAICWEPDNLTNQYVALGIRPIGVDT